MNCPYKPPVCTETTVRKRRRKTVTTSHVYKGVPCEQHNCRFWKRHPDQYHGICKRVERELNNG